MSCRKSRMRLSARISKLHSAQHTTIHLLEQHLPPVICYNGPAIFARLSSGPFMNLENCGRHWTRGVFLNRSGYLQQNS